MTTGSEIETRLRAELRERPLDDAASCPSWRVYADWLLQQGDPRGEWLALALDPACAVACKRVGEAVCRERDRKLGARDPASLSALHRGEIGWTRWLGPFVLAAICPTLGLQPGFPPELDRATFDELLGPHGVLLPAERAWVGGSWFGAALERHLSSPALLGLDDPALVEPLATLLGKALERRPGDRFIVPTGKPLPQVMPPLMPINPGPVFDPEAMQRAYAIQLEQSLERMLQRASALLTCFDDADLARHAADWSRVGRIGTCVLVGPRAVLERWPHAGRHLTLA